MKYCLLIFLLPLITFAQFTDNFDDGDLNQGVNWQGDVDKFKVNTHFQLQLIASGEGASAVHAPLSGTELLEWSFWVKLSFSPSDNNHSLVYITSDSPDLTLPLSGYYIKLGEGGSNDAIELYRQNQSEHILVARGKEGFLKDAFEIRVKVTRDDGLWEIWADSTGNYDYSKQASGSEEYWQSYSHFSLVCKYTSSNSTKFYFDDIYAGPRIIDTSAPMLINLTVNGDCNLELHFSEPMQQATCAIISNYNVNSDFGAPLAAGRDLADPALVHLLFQDKFPENTPFELTVSNLKDQAGNQLKPVSVPFIYKPLKQFDIVINEIMADPDPPVALPICEYIELYNRSSAPIHLKDWQLIIGETKKTIPHIAIEPHGFHLLTGKGNDSLMAVYGQASAITGLSLSNTGNCITLANDKGAVIHSATYDLMSYHDQLKENGGWSLEQVDPQNPCGSYENWHSSKDSRGGTPGSQNSVFATNADTVAPAIEYITVSGESSIKVYFNESMDSASLLNPYKYMVDNGLGTPASVTLHAPQYKTVNLIFSERLVANTLYRLTFSETLTDCVGNNLTGSMESFFGLPEPIAVSDIVINEILFDASTNGEEFIEIYNRSNKIIDIGNLWLATRDATTGAAKSPCMIIPDGRLIFPGDYIVTTKDPGRIKTEYATLNPQAFIKTPSLPPMLNSGGTIVLMTTEGLEIDELNYTDEMHNTLLNTTKGVSLERVNPDLGTNEPGNWHSAAQTVGFATPGYRNSQFLQPGIANCEVALEPKTFSPDNDGFNDILSITCKFTEPGNLVSIRIFDSNGRLIKVLAGNHLSGDYNVFNWDGLSDKRTLVPSGIYIVYTEILNLNGQIRRHKNVAVVARG